MCLHLFALGDGYVVGFWITPNFYKRVVLIPEVNIFAFLNRQTLLKLLILAFLMKGLGWRFVRLKGEAVTLNSEGLWCAYISFWKILCVPAVLELGGNWSHSEWWGDWSRTPTPQSFPLSHQEQEVCIYFLLVFKEFTEYLINRER